MDYMKGHKECGIKVGDTVRVLRKAENEESGWVLGWLSEMDDNIGKTGVVERDDGKSGFYVAISDTCGRFYPYFVLEKVMKDGIYQWGKGSGYDGDYFKVKGGISNGAFGSKERARSTMTVYYHPNEVIYKEQLEYGTFIEPLNEEKTKEEPMKEITLQNVYGAIKKELGSCTEARTAWDAVIKEYVGEYGWYKVIPQEKITKFEYVERLKALGFWEEEGTFKCAVGDTYTYNGFELLVSKVNYGRTPIVCCLIVINNECNCKGEGWEHDGVAVKNVEKITQEEFIAMLNAPQGVALEVYKTRKTKKED